jgi:hypothetical protein
VSRSTALPEGYELVRLLGAGGFGEVHLARQMSLGRLVAVKRIHSFALADEESLARFRREARTLAAMTHPAVVRVYDFQHRGGDATLIMEYVDGQSLLERLEFGPLPIDTALTVLRDVADALTAAADSGIAHRDVKPGNVFVLPTGHAKLGDFGLARIVSDPSVFRTVAGRESGTPAYFPPELSEGTAEPSPSSDAYSFAVMAFEMLTGRQPFEGAGPIAVIAAHWSAERPDPRAIVPGFPDAAARALMSALSKNPSARPLPAALVDRLSQVPMHAWPKAVSRQRRPEAGAVMRAPATIHVPDALVPPHSTVVARRKRRGWVRVLLLGGILGAAVVASVSGWRMLASPDSSPLAVDQVTVRSDPASGSGKCPSASFEFTATIATNGSPGLIKLQWTQPDGRTVGKRRVDVRAGQRQVTARLHFAVQGTRPLHGRAVLVVLAPAGVPNSGRDMSYVCAGSAAS